MNNAFADSDLVGYYQLTRPVSEDEILDMAKSLINQRFARGSPMTSPVAARDFLILNLAHLEHEVFCCLFLDNQHRILRFEAMFRGTLDGASVYPREVVKRALELNAGALILAHNHPSGVAEPSEADRNITRKLSESMNLIDVRVLDHFVIGGDVAVSFAERGLL